MNMPALNYDTLLLIGSAADDDTKSRMMKTCRDLYQGYAKILLRDKDVALSTEDDLISFSLFMHADNGVRMPFLTGYLTLRSDLKLSPSSSSVLANMFRSLAPRSRLQNLIINEAENTLSVHEDLPAAIASLTSLTYLYLGEAGPVSYRFLSNVRSELEEVGFAMRGGGDEPLIDRLDREEGVVPQLHQSKTSLEALYATFPGRSSSDWPVFPHVEHVQFELVFAPVTIHYVRALPNADTLMFQVLVDETDEDECRAANRADQVRHGSWSSLPCFRGSLRSLYMLGLTCHVGKLVLDSEDDADHYDSYRLRAILTDTTPHILNMFTCTGSLIFDEAAKSVLHEHASHLDRLHIKFKPVGSDDDFDVCAAIALLVELVSKLELSSFALTFDMQHLSESSCSMAKEMRALNPYATAILLKSAAPSVKRVDVAFLHCSADSGEVRVAFGTLDDEDEDPQFISEG